jgi:hypothetical protein
MKTTLVANARGARHAQKQSITPLNHQFFSGDSERFDKFFGQWDAIHANVTTR